MDDLETYREVYPHIWRYTPVSPTPSEHWYFSDETEDFHGPYPTIIVAVMQFNHYVRHLEYGDA